MLVFTPISAVLVVLLGVLHGGVRPFRCARVYSGPTEGVAELSLRVEIGERAREVETPVSGASFEVQVLDGGRRLARARGQSDALGIAELTLVLPRAREAAFELLVEPLGGVEPPLARGLVFGKKQAFLARATRRGGFQRGRHSGDIDLAVAPARGVLVTAQGALEDELVISAQRRGSPVSGARIRVKLEGAEPAEREVTTDERGLARLTLRPSDAQVRVQLDADAGAAGLGMLAARLEVVQGALRVTRKDERLLVETSGAANRAFLGFFDETRRHGGLSLPLVPAADGRLVGEVAWPAGLVAAPLWVVASSEPDLASPSAVGWPVVTRGEPDPKTFDAKELLLLDGAPTAKAREERRARRIRWVSAAYASLALFVTLLLFVRRVRASERDIERHLRRSGLDELAPGIAPARQGRAVLAAACIALGFIVLALFALLKE